MLLPTARGPLSAGVIAAVLAVGSARPSGTTDDPEELTGDADFQLALWIALETLDGGFEGVENDQADLVPWRTWLSERWAKALREMTAPVVRAAGGDTASPSLIGDHLISLMRGGHTGLYTFAEHRATAAQLRELLAAKSLTGSSGHTLVDRVPAVALAAHNTTRVLGHGTTPAAALGHRAASAARSWLSGRKLDRGLRRAGLQPVTTLEAPERRWDRSLAECRAHLAENPGRTQDLLHGAAAAIVLEARLGWHLLRCWAQATPVLEPVRTAALPVIGEQSRTRARLHLTSIPADPDEGRPTDVRCG